MKRQKLEQLPKAWMRESKRLRRRYAAEQLAAVTRQHAVELSLALAGYWNEDLSLAEACTWSGYTRDYLRKLVRDGTLANLGTTREPRFRRGDLPRKAGLVDPAPPAGGPVRGADVHPIAASGLEGVRSRRQIARAVASGE